MDDITAEIEQMRRIAMNITGFHALIEDETINLSPVKRLEYEAQVYAGGVELAKSFARLDQLLRN
jgi:hypothetical protein